MVGDLSKLNELYYEDPLIIAKIINYMADGILFNNRQIYF